MSWEVKCILINGVEGVGSNGCSKLQHHGEDFVAMGKSMCVAFHNYLLYSLVVLRLSFTIT